HSTPRLYRRKFHAPRLSPEARRGPGAVSRPGWHAAGHRRECLEGALPETGWAVLARSRHRAIDPAGPRESTPLRIQHERRCAPPPLPPRWAGTRARYVHGHRSYTYQRRGEDYRGRNFRRWQDRLRGHGYWAPPPDQRRRRLADRTDRTYALSQFLRLGGGPRAYSDTYRLRPIGFHDQRHRPAQRLARQCDYVDRRAQSTRGAAHARQR